MEIVKISDTEVKVIDNKNSYRIFTKEELEQKIEELTAKTVKSIGEKSQ